MKKPEILAPAGNWDSLKMAIAHGADAVYLGIDEFNARGNIENFTLENLTEVTKYCHLFGVKIYLTLNILFKDDEFAKVDEIIDKSSKAGVDAFIIQDIGLYYYIKNIFPNLEIHASTQMGLQNLEGATFARDLGFKRVVLARETPLCDIEKIYKELGIDIEYFVQGALCVSFSGNCYLCSLLAGASGNRGKCKQFCRLPYEMDKDSVTKKGYLLSTKDFCMLPRLKDLCDRGVTSFKIEGRARRAAYVGQAVKTYRQVVDNNFVYSDQDIEKLKKVYNRGDYICGYFNNEKIIYSKAQNHIGIKIGRVEGVNNGKRFNIVKVCSSHKLKKDDVVKFFIEDEEAGIISVNDIKEVGKNLYELTTTNQIPPKAEMRLIVDSQDEQKILQTTRRLKVKGEFTAFTGENAKLKFSCNEVVVEAISEQKLESARTSKLTYEDCFNQFSKLGDEFELDTLNVKCDDVFMAKSQLNDLRRKAIEGLKIKLVEKYTKTQNLVQKAEKINKNIEFFNKKQENKSIIAFSDFEKLDKNKLKNSMLIYKPSNFSLKNIASVYNKYSDFDVYISLPIIASSDEVEVLREVISYCKNWGIVANNYYSLNLTGKEKTIIGEGLNVFNSFAVKFYTEQGYTKIIVSNEVDRDQNIENNGAWLLYYQSYYPEYMTFKHCPIKENIGGDCGKCKFEEGYVYKLNNTRFNLVRRKIILCQFALKGVKRVDRILGENYTPIYEV